MSVSRVEGGGVSGTLLDSAEEDGSRIGSGTGNGRRGGAGVGSGSTGECERMGVSVDDICGGAEDGLDVRTDDVSEVGGAGGGVFGSFCIFLSFGLACPGGPGFPFPSFALPSSLSSSLLLTGSWGAMS